MPCCFRRNMEITKAHPSLHDNQTLVSMQKTYYYFKQAGPFRILRLWSGYGNGPKALDEVSTHLTPQIVKGEGNIVFHCEWDNLNKTTSSVHGSNIVNNAGGIMVQEVNSEFEHSDVPTLPVIDKSLQRSLKVDTPATLPPLTFNRVGPKFPEGCKFTMPAEVEAVYATKVQEYCLWLFARYVASGGIQTVPALGGFISVT